MSLLIGQDLAKRFGGEAVFEGVSVQVGRTDRIALIGPNGCGKTTLLKLLAGREEPDEGHIERIGGVCLGYLPQEPKSFDEGQAEGLADRASGHTLYEEMLSVPAFQELRRTEEELRALEARLGHEAGEALRRYDALLSAFERGGGYTYERRIRRVLAGLGFSAEDEARPVAHLSGGEAARASLAKLLLEEPDLLLLDEPTNHLDTAALEWLEETLSRWRGAFVIASHDRRLIDRLATKVWAMEAGRLKAYPGNYSKYLTLRQAETERQWKLYKEQQEWIQRSEEFIRRHIAGQKTKQAQARRKMLEKLERIEKPRTAKAIRFTIEPTRPSGKRVLTLKDLVVGFPAEDEDGAPGPEKEKEKEKVLFTCERAVLNRGDRVALIGPNGSGKTTLLRTILGRQPPLRGVVEWGSGVEVAYTPQRPWDDFRREMTLIEAILDLEGCRWTIPQARDYLGKFLFSGDEVFKRLDQLSGGERSRLALARLAQLGGNLLLLDEPTNHLDIPARETLEEALLRYRGTILFVSHDRYFIAKLATGVWELRDGRLHTYRGGYETYLRLRERALREGLSSAAGDEGVREFTIARPAGKMTPGKLQRLRARALERLQRREAELTERIHALEEEIAQLERELEAASYAGDRVKIHELHERYMEKQAALDGYYERWHELAKELDRQRQLG